MTLRDIYRAGLLAAGYEFHKSTKMYECLHKSGTYVYLGSRGSVRISRGFARIDTSIAASEKTKLTIRLWARDGYPTAVNQEQNHEA